jgi:SAM-dependent methyltransferase
MAHGDRPRDPAQRAKQANSFGSAAASYEHARPSYPPEAVRDVLPDGSRRVLDLGAGTGKLSRILLAEGHDVVAVDPDAEMLEILGAVLPAAERHVGRAEAIPIPDASVDAVFAGQAFHWFDPLVAGPEFVRVLRPGGVVALLWNVRNSDGPAWIEEYDRLVDMVRHESDELAAPELGPLFTDPEVRWYDHVQHLNIDTLVELANSRSYVITAPADQRADVLRAVRALGERALAAAGTETLSLPYRLQVWTATPHPPR